MKILEKYIVFLDLLFRDKETRKFDSKDFVCITRTKDKHKLPVVILKSRTDINRPYKIVYNAGSTSFENYYDAITFYQERFINHGAE